MHKLFTSSFYSGIHGRGAAWWPLYV